jgi:hypothetical protein
MAAGTKENKRKEEAYAWKAGASNGHITNLKQSISETFDIYGPISVAPSKVAKASTVACHCRWHYRQQMSPM